MQLTVLVHLLHHKLVSLRSNHIEDYNSISFLFLCPRLESLVLMGNPVAEEPEYRDVSFRCEAETRVLCSLVSAIMISRVYNVNLTQP